MDYTICFIGSEETFALLGKEATKSDLWFRHYQKGSKVLTFIKPLGYPDKIKTLIQSLNMSDQVIIELNEINKELAEIMVAADLLMKKGKFIVPLNKQYLIEELKKIIKGTSLGVYEQKIINNNEDLVELRDGLLTEEPETTSELLIALDHAFEVKNVGLVVLGFITGGEINARDQCLLQPGKKSIQVKTIQCMDQDFKSVKAKARVGLSLKNCRLDEVARGSVIVKKELPELTELKGRLERIEYYKAGLRQGAQLIAVNGLQAIQGEVSQLEPLIIKLQKPMVMINPETILFDPNAAGLRLIGKIVSN